MLCSFEVNCFLITNKLFRQTHSRNFDNLKNSWRDFLSLISILLKSFFKARLFYIVTLSTHFKRLDCECNANARALCFNFSWIENFIEKGIMNMLWSNPLRAHLIHFLNPCYVNIERVQMETISYLTLPAPVNRHGNVKTSL